MYRSLGAFSQRHTVGAIFDGRDRSAEKKLWRIVNSAIETTPYSKKLSKYLLRNIWTLEVSWGTDEEREKVTDRCGHSDFFTSEFDLPDLKLVANLIVS